MDRIMSILRKPAFILVLVFTSVYVLLKLLYAIGTMAAGNVSAVFGGLFFILCFGALAFALIFALIKKNTKAARLIGTIFFAFLAIRLVYSLIGGDGYGVAISKAMFSFDLFAELCGITIFAFVILKVFFQKLENNKIIDTVTIAALCGYICFSLLARILEFGVYGYFAKEYNYNFAWYSIVDNLGDIFLLGAVLFGYILLFTKPVEIVVPIEGTEQIEESAQEIDETQTMQEAPSNEDESIPEEEVKVDNTLSTDKTETN